MKRKVKQKKNVHLSTLTIVFISIAVILAVTICVSYFYTVYSRSILRDATVISKQVVSQSTIAVDNYLDGMKEKLSKISIALSKSHNTEEFKNDMAMFSQMENDIYSIMIYDSDGKLILSVSDTKEMKPEIYKDLSFDKDVFSKGNPYSLSEPHVNTLFAGEYPWVVTMALKEFQPIFNDDVYIAIDFSFSGLAKYIDHVGIGQHGYCYIADNVGNMVYHPQQQILNAGLKSEDNEVLKSLTDGTHKENNKIYAVETTKDSEWRIVGVHYTDELKAEKHTQIVNGIIISIFSIVAILWVMLSILSKRVNKPINDLVCAMQSFENSAEIFTHKSSPQTVTELQVLNDSFAHLVLRTQELMEKVRKEEIILRKTELKALQAQINPHFLYNTLDSIQWMCEQGNNEDAVKMVGALAKLFRISISRGKELISIRDELQHAKSYLIIQSFRYQNQFSYNFNVDENLLDYLCNKITIQPLIENAIYHGIDRMVDEGEININVFEDENGDILITVEDNGVGMTEEQCKKILAKDRSDSGGIGVKNVNDRLKIYFGKKYGLTIESELDVGTKVTVRMPKVKEENTNEA